MTEGAEMVTGGTDERTATEGEEMTMRAYKGVLGLLIKATERLHAQPSMPAAAGK